MQAVKGKHRTPSIKTRISGSHFVTVKVFGLLLIIRGSVPDCCIVLGKPNDRVNHVELYVTTLFMFTWPMDKAQNAHKLVNQGFDSANYFGVHGALLQTPSFMRGERQLSLKEVVMSKKHSEVHIDVQPIINLLKQIPNKYYKVLSHFV